VLQAAAQWVKSSQVAFNKKQVTIARVLQTR